MDCGILRVVMCPVSDPLTRPWLKCSDVSDEELWYVEIKGRVAQDISSFPQKESETSLPLYVQCTLFMYTCVHVDDKEKWQMVVLCFHCVFVRAWRQNPKDLWQTFRQRYKKIQDNYLWHLFKWTTDGAEQIEQQLRGEIRNFSTFRVCLVSWSKHLSVLVDSSEDVGFSSVAL